MTGVDREQYRGADTARERVLGAVRSRFARFVGPVGFVLVVAMVRGALPTALVATLPYLFYPLAVMGAAAIWGVASAVLAVLATFMVRTLVEAVPTDLTLHSASAISFMMVSAALIGIAVLLRQMRSRADRACELAQISEQEARVANEELRLLLQAAPDLAIYLLDPHGRIELWSNSATRITGWAEADVVGQSADLFHCAADRANGLAASHLALAERTGRVVWIGRCCRKDGSEFVARTTITALRFEDGTLRGFGKIMHDVTDEARAAEAVELQERLLRSILQAVPEALVVVDGDGNVVLFSTAAERLFDRPASAIIGQPAAPLLRDILTLDGMPIGHDRLSDLPPDTRLLATADRPLRPDVPVEVSIGRTRFQERGVAALFIRDRRADLVAQGELEALQARLLYVSRVSAMGTMASTLAHELNQPLAAVESYIATAEHLLGTATPDRERIAGILTAASQQTLRAGNIIQRARHFVTRGEIEFTRHDLGQVIREIVMMTAVGDTIGDVRIETDIDADVGHVLIDRVQIQQVLINLIRNAIDAVDSEPQPRIGIAASRTGDGVVVVRVADNGPGISTAQRASLFSTFSTTKSHGLGVGLSISRTIVEAHHGRIWHESGADRGATFAFSLPTEDAQQVAAE